MFHLIFHAFLQSVTMVTFLSYPEKDIKQFKKLRFFNKIKQITTTDNCETFHVYPDYKLQYFKCPSYFRRTNHNRRIVHVSRTRNAPLNFSRKLLTKSSLCTVRYLSPEIQLSFIYLRHCYLHQNATLS